jgi:hypothetical protein
MHAFHSTGTSIQLTLSSLSSSSSLLLPDLATVVDSQGNAIQDLETMAMESLDHASSGVSHIWSMQARFKKSSQEYKYWYAAAMAILLFGCAHWIRIRSSRSFEANDDDDDMPDY